MRFFIFVSLLGYGLVPLKLYHVLPRRETHSAAGVGLEDEDAIVEVFNNHSHVIYLN